LGDLDRDALRRQIGVIFQDFLQYQLTAGANIAMGRHEAFEDHAAVVAAAELAGAHDFVSALPAGYDTLLTRAFLGGVELSIGEWQRVAVARAFFSDSSLLVLDEPTAALDPRGEHELFESVRALAKGRTVVLISHRFSTVKSADRIYVIDDGRVAASGTHDELVACPQGGPVRVATTHREPPIACRGTRVAWSADGAVASRWDRHDPRLTQA
jgi:ATP-binding cassette subfamily B protein